MLPLTGAITIPDKLSFTLHSDLNDDTLWFTLTCISTGGPATTVTWTYPDSEVVTTGNMTMLNNAESAEYIHTLNMTGRLRGRYTCTVGNSKPSFDSRQLSIKGTELINMTYLDSKFSSTVANPPMDLTVTTSEESSTISVFWSSPIGGDAVTGYLVYYHHPNYNVTIINRTSNNLNDTFTERTTTQRVYTVSIQALSEHLPSIMVGPVTARGKLVFVLLIHLYTFICYFKQFLVQYKV